MAVTVDQQTFDAEAVGVRTVGELISHLQAENRLVIHLLIDGVEPDLEQLTAVRQSAMAGHEVYVETTDPREIAMQVLTELGNQLQQTDVFKNEAVELLQSNQAGKAMEKLSACFNVWQDAQESLLKTAQLMQIDLNTISVGGKSLTGVLEQFADQLRQIKSALENRDFVSLADILNYEMAETAANWQAAIAALKGIVAGR